MFSKFSGSSVTFSISWWLAACCFSLTNHIKTLTKLFKQNPLNKPRQQLPPSSKSHQHMLRATKTDLGRQPFVCTHPRPFPIITWKYNLVDFILSIDYYVFGGRTNLDFSNCPFINFISLGLGGATFVRLIFSGCFDKALNILRFDCWWVY